MVTARRKSAKKRASPKKKTVKRRTAKKSKRASKRTVTKKKKISKKRTSKKKKVIRRKARKALIRGTRSQVFNGTRKKVKTTGQTKKELMKNKRGKIVSKIAYKAGRTTYKRNGLDKWNKAFMKARENLGLSGFVAIKKGTPFYDECMKIYKN